MEMGSARDFDPPGKSVKSSSPVGFDDAIGGQLNDAELLWVERWAEDVHLSWL